MMSSNEKLKCRKFPCIIKYHVPNKYTHPEEYAHHMLFMHLLLRHGNELKIYNSYDEKLYLSNVLETINVNCIKVEPYATFVEDVLERLTTSQEANIDRFCQQKNDEMTVRLNEELENINIDESFADEEFT